MATYFVMLDQNGDSNMPNTHFTVAGKLLVSGGALPRKTGLTASELQEYLITMGIPLSGQMAIFRELGQVRHYSFTATLAISAASELWMAKR